MIDPSLVLGVLAVLVILVIFLVPLFRKENYGAEARADFWTRDFNTGQWRFNPFTYDKLKVYEYSRNLRDPTAAFRHYRRDAEFGGRLAEESQKDDAQKEKSSERERFESIANRPSDRNGGSLRNKLLALDKLDHLPYQSDQTMEDVLARAARGELNGNVPSRLNLRDPQIKQYEKDLQNFKDGGAEFGELRLFKQLHA